MTTTRYRVCMAGAVSDLRTYVSTDVALMSRDICLSLALG